MSSAENTEKPAEEVKPAVRSITLLFQIIPGVAADVRFRLNNYGIYCSTRHFICGHVAAEHQHTLVLEAQ